MKMVKTTELEATYQVVTPMFCGGADQQAELRLPSFKGVLRWWWRALAWTYLNCDLDRVKRDEDLLFGSAAGGQKKKGGQARVLMRLAARPEPTIINKDHPLTGKPGERVGPGARYLGYGVMVAFGNDAKLERSCLAAPFEFRVQIRARNLEQPQLDLLKRSLEAVGFLGGMGAKSRKGYGSLALTGLEGDGVSWSSPTTLTGLGAAVKCLCPTNPDDEWPPYTALSCRARHVLLVRDTSDPLVMLDAIGREQVHYRSWGHDGTILDGERANQYFKRDHDLMKADADSRDRTPERIAFGLPHNYGKGPDRQVGPAEAGLDRRASPLLIHIHPLDNRVAAVVSLLPARFLPEEADRIKVGSKELPLVTHDELYGPVERFLDRLLDKGARTGNGVLQRKEHFDEAVEVRACQ